MDEFIKKAEELKMKALRRIEQKLTSDVSPTMLDTVDKDPTDKNLS